MISEEMTFTGQHRIANKALIDAKKQEIKRGLVPYYFREYFKSTSQNDMNLVFFFEKGLIKQEVISKMIRKNYSGEINIR